MLCQLMARLPARGDDRGSLLGSMMFAVLLTAVLATAALATLQVTNHRTTSERAGMALLAIGDRVQVALDEVNSTRTGTALSRITQETNKAPQCDELGVCTWLTATSTGGEIHLRVAAGIRGQRVTPDEQAEQNRLGMTAQATRAATLSQLPTTGVVTGVDADGRLEFVQVPGATGTDLWQVNTEENS